MTKKKEAVQQDQQEEPRVQVLRRATAVKASGGKIEYEVCRVGDEGALALRLAANDSSGTFSKELVPFDKVRDAFADAEKRGGPFRPGPVAGEAMVGRSKNNGPFLAYALLAEGLLQPGPDGDGKVTTTGQWEAWANAQPKSGKPDPQPERKAPSAAPKKKAARKAAGKEEAT